jgi:Ca-activated chloride channel family protein
MGASEMKQRSFFAATVLTAVVMGVAGCSSGGSSSGGSGGSSPPPPPPPPPAGAPIIQVLPASAYDFGTVTGNNQPAPLQVTIRNTGTANLAVQGIGFQTQVQGFVLDPSPAVKPCASVTPTVAPNDQCNILVRFAPPADGAYTTSLQVTSNGGAPVVLGIRGTRGAVSSLTVRVNQIDFAACNLQPTTAYVSVTDQGGFPVISPLAGFGFSQGTSSVFGPVASVSFIDAAYKQIAISAILDNSGSLTSQPVAFADMNSGFASLLAQLKPTDVAEIVKFASVTQVVQSWTSNKTLLAQAITAPFNGGQDTRLWDSVYDAAETFTSVPGGPAAYRRVIVVATDGIDEGPTIGSPGGIRTLQNTIDKANERGVAVFTIGFGSSVNDTDLNRLARDTGGVYYRASQSQNLATIYQQLSQLLFTNQYVVTFNRSTTSPGQTPINLRATSGALSGDGSRAIACP